MELREIMEELKKRLKPCPRCGIRQMLNEIWIQKKEWGGKFSPENSFYLCASCDEDWRNFVAKKKIKGDFSVFKQAFEEFLKTKPEVRNKTLAILKELGSLRILASIEKVRFESRFRTRAGRLEKIFPFSESSLAKSYPEFKNWREFLLLPVAEQIKQRRALDKEILRHLENVPIWKFYLKHIPGIGPGIASYLIGILGSGEGWWCEHVFETRKFKCPLCPPEERKIKREGIKRFPSTADLFGYAGLRVEEGRAERRKRGQKLNYRPLLKILIVQIIPSCLLQQVNRSPWSPYSKLFQQITKEEEEKAIALARRGGPERCQIISCNETEIVNLGWKCQNPKCNFRVPFEKEEEARAHQRETGHKVVFAGFCCKKTLNTSNPHYYLNPAHRQRRVMRKIGKKFLADFYYTWLWMLGEEIDLSQNERILTILNLNR